MNRETLTSRATALLRAPAVLDDDAATSFVDLQGFDAVEVLIAHGAVTAAAGANNIAFAIEIAPDGADPEDEGEYAAAPTADLIGSFTLLANAVAAGVQRVAYRGPARYLRVTADETGTASAVVGVVAVLDKSDRSPANAKTPATGTAT